MAAYCPCVATTEGPRLALRVLTLGGGHSLWSSCVPPTLDLFLGGEVLQLADWTCTPSLGQAAWPEVDWGSLRSLEPKPEAMLWGRCWPPPLCVPRGMPPLPSFLFVFSLAPFKALNPGSREHVTEQVWGFCQDVVCGCLGLVREMCVWDSWTCGRGNRGMGEFDTRVSGQIKMIEHLLWVELCPPRYSQGFSGGLASKESACDAGDLGSILGWEDPLEKGTATPSSILAWRIPWTG